MFAVPEDDHSIKELHEHYFFQMHLSERMDICTAARKSFQQYTPALPKLHVHRAKILEIYYPDGKEKHVALHCPATAFNVYLCLGSSTSKIEVILIEEDPSIEVGRESVASNYSRQESVGSTSLQI